MGVASARTDEAPIRADGHLVNIADWTPNIAVYLSSQQGLTLTDEHWEIINIMRDYYKTYNISPIRKLLLREIKEKLGNDKASNDYLKKLFPGDVMEQGVQIAGIPVPLLDSEMRKPGSKPAVANASASSTYEIGFGGKTISFYAKGNLVHLEDWTPALAEFLAEKEGITLTEAHWDVINFLRDFYTQYGIAPMVKLLVKHIRQQLGPDIGNNEYLYTLFPKGPARQGSKIAGLPEPQGCIDP